MTQRAGALLLQTPKPHFSSSSQSAHQLTDDASGLAGVAPVCATFLSIFCPVSMNSEMKGWKGCFFFFLNCHVRRKSSYFFNDFKMLNDEMQKELM